MIETAFQALFTSYKTSAAAGKENPIPSQLHLMVYNYARVRHGQTSDVAADFYLFVAQKLEGILSRYDTEKLPFYQYMASMLNFEFTHFLRRRRLPRTHIQVLSVEELKEKRVELTDRQKNEDDSLLEEILQYIPPQERLYSKIALATSLTYKELKGLIAEKRKSGATGWETLRAYREYLRFIEKKRHTVSHKRAEVLKALSHIEHDILNARGDALVKLKKRKEAAEKKFFSIDTRIPIRIVAATLGDSVATAQRRLKKVAVALKKAWLLREKQKLNGPRQNKKRIEKKGKTKGNR
ncbi:MAG: hypothetical protein LDLANPLL_00716 [Turneriella sp.]|nr:hypothetical protein [Turneriella sp.]